MIANSNTTGIRDIYLSLDSKYRIRSTRIADRIQFNIINRIAATDESGNVGVISPLVKLIEMEIIGSTWFPKQYLPTFAVGLPDVVSVDNDKVNMEIIELNQQSANNYNNKSTHFIFKVAEIVGETTRVKITPINPKYIFGQLTQIETISLRFYNPYNPAIIYDDFYECTINYKTANGVINNGESVMTVVALSSGESVTAHNLTTGDCISFENIVASTFSPDDNTQLTHRSKYYKITSVPTALSFTVGIDFSLSPNIANDINRNGDARLGPYNTFAVANVSYIANSGQPGPFNVTEVNFVYEHGYQIGDSLYIQDIPIVGNDVMKKRIEMNIWTVTSVANSKTLRFNNTEIDTLWNVSNRPTTITFRQNPRIYSTRLATVRIHVGTRRIVNNMRFRTLDSQRTNSIVPV